MVDTLRMVHVLGGPPKELQYKWNGNHLMVQWPLTGWVEIVKTTGALSHARKGPWRVHPDDLGRITQPYREQSREAMRKYFRNRKGT